MTTCYIAVDDTDNEASRGTGFPARFLACKMEEAGLIRTLGVTRHQLLVDSRIPYTSHNSSACITAECGARDQEQIAAVDLLLTLNRRSFGKPRLAVVVPSLIVVGAVGNAAILAVKILAGNVPQAVFTQGITFALGSYLVFGALGGLLAVPAATRQVSRSPSG